MKRYRVVRILPGESVRIATGWPRVFAHWGVWDMHEHILIAATTTKDDAQAEASFANQREAAR